MMEPRATCHLCSYEDEQLYMWADGYNERGVEQFLCQDCHEAEVDRAWWEVVGPTWTGLTDDAGNPLFSDAHMPEYE